MRLIANIPKMLNDLSPFKGNMFLLAADDVVYKIIIPTNNKKRRDNVEIQEVFRWSGTDILSISHYKDLIAAGTNRGVIVFKNGRASPVWVGYPCNVFAGNFSEKIDVVCLAKPPHKMSRILDLFAFSSEDVFKGLIKSVRGSEDEIVYFATNMGPINQFAFNRVRDLTVKADIDGDKRDELLLITPEDEPTLYLVDFVGDEAKIHDFPLPSFVGNPILLDYVDINHDGEEELYVVSMRGDYEALLSIITLDYSTETERRARTIAVAKINALEHIPDEVSDDGIFHVFGGEFDSDGLPEIIGLWEEPVGDLGYKIRIWPFKLHLMGEIECNKDEYIEEISIKRIIPYDIDSDNRLELITFTESGFSIYRLTKRARKIRVKKIYDLKLPLYISQVSKGAKNVLLAGPLAEDVKDQWSILTFYTDERKMHLIALTGPVKRLISFNNNHFILLSDKNLLIVDDDCKLFINDVTDIAEYHEEIYCISNNGINKISFRPSNCHVKLSKVNENETKEMRFADDITMDSRFIVFTEKEIIDNLSNGKKEKVMIPDEIGSDVLKVCKVPYGNKKMFLLITSNSAFLINKTGEITVRKPIRYDNVTNIVISDFDNDEYPELLYTLGGELYYWRVTEKYENRLLLDNITALSIVGNLDKKLVVAFKNNWVAEYDISEVLFIEHK